jgi:hypothetical protein
VSHWTSFQVLTPYVLHLPPDREPEVDSCLCSHPLPLLEGQVVTWGTIPFDKGSDSNEWRPSQRGSVSLPSYTSRYAAKALCARELTPRCRIIEVLDKGKAAAVTTQVTTKDKKTGTVIFENQSTVFIRGSGGFGGQRVGKGTLANSQKWLGGKLRRFFIYFLGDSPGQKKIDRGPATAANDPPKRRADAIIEEKTTNVQAALYRLNGDLNPLHVRFYPTRTALHRLGLAEPLFFLDPAGVRRHWWI